MPSVWQRSVQKHAHRRLIMNKIAELDKEAAERSCRKSLVGNLYFLRGILSARYYYAFT